MPWLRKDHDLGTRAVLSGVVPLPGFSGSLSVSSAGTVDSPSRWSARSVLFRPRDEISVQLGNDRGVLEKREGGVGQAKWQEEGRKTKKRLVTKRKDRRKQDGRAVKRRKCTRDAGGDRAQPLKDDGVKR